MNEMQKRFENYRTLPKENEKDFQAREAAWLVYCDARDGVPDGTSLNRKIYLEGRQAKITY